MNKTKPHLRPAALHHHQAVQALRQVHLLPHQVNVILLREAALQAAHRVPAAPAALTLAAHQAAHLAHQAAHLLTHHLTLRLLNPATLIPARTSTRKDLT